MLQLVASSRTAEVFTAAAVFAVLGTAWLMEEVGLSLALAMTEKHEKAERAEIMRERGCTELEAVHIVAGRIAVQRGG